MIGFYLRLQALRNHTYSSGAVAGPQGKPSWEVQPGPGSAAHGRKMPSSASLYFPGWISLAEKQAAFILQQIFQENDINPHLRLPWGMKIT